MVEPSQPTFTESELDRLQRLRVSVLAFQKSIGSLPADEQSNALNEQFNHLRLEAKALLKGRGFDQKVARALTEELLAERAQKKQIPRLSIIVIFGVMLALLGLGINSVILEDVLINSLGCLISSSGMLLIIGAFSLLATRNLRKQRLTNFGDLYQRCSALISEIEHALNMAIPNWTDRPAVDIPEIPSVVEMLVDSLEKQAANWRQKLRNLEGERLSLGPDAPRELTINIDFVQRELNRVMRELDQVSGRVLLAAETGVSTDSKPQDVVTAAAKEIASAHTGGMPVAQTAQTPDVEEQDTSGEPADEVADKG